MPARPVSLRNFLSIALLITAVFVVGATLDRTTLSPRLRLALVLIPIPIAIWAFREYIRDVRSWDEFQRKAMLEALAIAFPLTLMMAMVVGLLQKGGFMMPVSVSRLWPFQALVWVVALGYTDWKYR